MKLADFGLAKLKSPDTNLKSFCGTPNYLAPEILRVPVRTHVVYTHMVDIWSLGCVLYTMLTCKMTFDKNDEDFIRNIEYVNYPPPTRRGVPVSAEAVDMMRQMIRKQADERSTATQCMQHHWMLMGPNDVARAKKDVEDYSKTLMDVSDDFIDEAAAIPYQEEEELEIVVNENLPPMNSPDVNGPEGSNEAKRIRLQ